MDGEEVLASFDEQVRRDPRPSDPRARIEREEHLTRVIEPGGWAGISWSDLGGLDLDQVIAGEIARFAEVPGEWEWKHYSHDSPPALPERLIAAGFQAGERETVLVAEASELAREGRLPEGVTIERVGDAQAVSALLGMQDEVFRRGVSGMEQAMLDGVTREPPSTMAIAAMFDGSTIAGGRVELDGSEFAGLWGGATVPAWRSRGIFRTLVAHGAALAAERGLRYVQADALETSRPILEGLGFIALATTTPYTFQNR